MRKKDLKDSIKDELRKMLADGQEPSEGRMKLLTLGIKYMAVEAKLEENEYGNFFSEEERGIKKPKVIKVNGTQEDGDQQVFTNE